MTGSGFTQDGEGSYCVRGPMTFETVGALWSQSRGEFDAGKTLLIDLDGVTAVDSAGLSLLVEWVRWARQRAGAASFTHVPAKLRALARIGELEGLLGMSGT